ncbi:toll-like receptor 3 [Sitodiplosis mosellana]|uniref:toll-like receptor 3 n=1 Tax=Sitodiplosis mosellana TaxID=263140 RepID=UPI00244411CF|nr:toll-like receptor 3 [Sitodiplosis mosellana]
MKSVGVWCVLSVVGLATLVFNKEIPLPCDEFKDEQLLYEGLYCTVAGIRLDDFDSFDCNVYPYYRHLVKVVKFTESRTINIPYMIFHYFDGIREFDISFTDLESIRRGDFIKAENLMYLSASHNKMSELTSSLFLGAPNISVVDFSYNNIEKVSASAFASAILMSRLHLSHNLLRTLDKNTFATMIMLDELHLDFNQLEMIDVDLFAHNTLLARLSLNNNRLIRLECDSIKELKYLNKIDLSVNKLEEFNTTCISGIDLDLIIHDNQLQKLTLRNVASLHASHNQIRHVYIENGISNLKSLKLASNNLTNITGIFEHLNSLETLDLSYNYVGKLNISTFAKLTNLEHLNLGHTNLSNINFGTFFHQKELKSLDISYNNLNKMNFDVFLPYLKNLEQLVLDGNNLTEMEGLTNSMFPQLSVLSISNNNFNCTYLAKLLRTLKWDELGLSIDPELVHTNETHINGIACDHPTNDSIAYNRVHNDHYDHQYNVHKAIVAILQPSHSSNQNNNNKISYTNNDIPELHISHSDRERSLEAHLLTMKYLLVFICCVCLAFVITKFVTIFRAHRKLDFHVASCGNDVYLQDTDNKYGIYQSTATMNTIQTNVAY